MSQHTPGPWHVYDADDFIVAAGDGFSICDCQPGNPIDVSDAQAVANARLIAAAPTMLAALEFIERACEPGTDQSDDELELFVVRVRELARIAIAKAEGKS